MTGHYEVHTGGIGVRHAKRSLGIGRGIGWAGRWEWPWFYFVVDGSLEVGGVVACCWLIRRDGLLLLPSGCPVDWLLFESYEAVA